MKTEPKFRIGQMYKTRGKVPRECLIIDVLKTFNSRGELVKIRYVSSHAFMGQVVTDSDVVEATIARGLL